MDVAVSFPWPWVDDRQQTPLNVRTLDDAQLGNLARYRGVLAANTNPRKPEHASALDNLREAFNELIRRQTQRYSLP